MTKRAAPTRADQRARLRAAMTRSIGEAGYLEVKVEQIARAARVSCTTFYELYADKEACFLDAHSAIAASLEREFKAALSGSRHGGATEAAARALAAFAFGEGDAFRLVCHEAPLVGASGVAARDELLRGLSASLDAAWGETNSTFAVPDIPPRLLLGGWIRALGVLVRSGTAAEAELVDELLGWAHVYEVTAGARSWHRELDELAASHAHEQRTQVEPVPLPRGRHRLSPSLVARVQRERLIYGTAAAIEAHGYERASVSDIVAAAGVSRAVFYTQFASKREALAATLRAFLESSVGAAAAAAFAPAASWEARLWQTLGALLEFFAEHAAFARAALVETYALDRQGGLTDEFVMGFATFLRGDGERERCAPTRVQAAAMIGAALEAIAMWAHAGRAGELAQLQGLLAYVLLVPAAGARAAGEYVATQSRSSPLHGQALAARARA